MPVRTLWFSKPARSAAPAALQTSTWAGPAREGRRFYQRSGSVATGYGRPTQQGSKPPQGSSGRSRNARFGRRLRPEPRGRLQNRTIVSLEPERSPVDRSLLTTRVPEAVSLPTPHTGTDGCRRVRVVSQAPRRDADGCLEDRGWTGIAIETRNRTPAPVEPTVDSIERALKCSPRSASVRRPPLPDPG